MKILEKVLFVIILIGLILKFSLVPGGDQLIFCAVSVLACVYYPFGFLFLNQIRLRDVFKKAAYKNVTAGKIILSIIAGMGVSTICIGSLFKLFNYDGADQMLLIASVTSFFALIPLIILLLKNDESVKFILRRVVVLGVIGVVLLFTPHLSIARFQYRNHPAYIKAYEYYLNNPKNETVVKKFELERNRIRMTEKEFKEYETSVTDVKD
jgi:hypothetical protein